MKKKKVLQLAAIVFLGLILAGCVVQPHPGVYVPPGVKYVRPVHPVPGPGYYWDYNPRRGWGWRHPVHGWYIIRK